ncbi:hypothetical protein IAS59_000061 [Cryptococcus gattii]
MILSTPIGKANIIFHLSLSTGDEFYTFDHHIDLIPHLLTYDGEPFHICSSSPLRQQPPAHHTPILPRIYLALANDFESEISVPALSLNYNFEQKIIALVCVLAS